MIGTSLGPVGVSRSGGFLLLTDESVFTTERTRQGSSRPTFLRAPLTKILTICYIYMS